MKSTTKVKQEEGPQDFPGAAAVGFQLTLNFLQLSLNSRRCGTTLDLQKPYEKTSLQLSGSMI